MTATTDELAGQVAIITGGGTGIGTAAARLLGGAGADLVLAARKLDRLEAVAAEIRGMGRRSSRYRPTCATRTKSRRWWSARWPSSAGSTLWSTTRAGATCFRWRPRRSTSGTTFFAQRAGAVHPHSEGGRAHARCRARGVRQHLLGRWPGGCGRGSGVQARPRPGSRCSREWWPRRWGDRGIRANTIAVGPVASEGARCGRGSGGDHGPDPRQGGRAGRHRERRSCTSRPIARSS